MTRRFAVIAAVVMATAVALVIAKSAITQARDTGRLILSPNGYSTCQQVSTTDDWLAQSTSGLSFGVDYFSLSSRSAHVTVTGVRMLGATGGMTLKSIAFVPFGSIGSGHPGNAGFVTSNAALTRMALSLPAHISRASAPSNLHLPTDGTEWELGVILSVPASANAGSTSGFEITYRSGTQTKHLITTDKVTVQRATC